MKHTTLAGRLLRGLAFVTLIGVAGLTVSSLAHASEVKFGEGPTALEVDAEGKLTEAGKKTAVKQLDKIPGEDAWDLRIWAKIDKGAPGPLYVEFWQTVEVMGNKQDAIVHRHEENDYDGAKYVSYSILLEGKVGFNKDRTYDVHFVQVNSKGKDMRLASAKLSLINTGREAPKDEEGEEEGEEEELSEQDELDGLAGGEGAETDGASHGDGPPPTEAGKKGCSVVGDPGITDTGLLLVVLAGSGARRRRRAA